MKRYKNFEWLTPIEDLERYTVFRRKVQFL